ncbi:ABC transporter permease subunit [Microbacterium sp. OR21]|uniref:ABC transporter permease n=1 Tax=Microbacterium sp. OR21 TaxID=3095346 RepID=UPI0039B46133
MSPARMVDRRPLRTALTVLALLLLWELAARLLEGAYVLAAPSEILLTLKDESGLLLRALGVTGAAALAGFAVGNLVALALAALAVLLPRTQSVVTTVALVVFCLPLVATGPVLRVLLGPGDGPQVALAALAVYYTTMIPVLVGLRAAPAGWFDLVRSYGRGRAAALRFVRARASLPYFIAGLQIAAPAAFLGAMVGEFTGAESGLGVLTVRAARDLDVQLTWAIATVATVVSVLAYALVGAIGRRLHAGPPPLILAPPRPPVAAAHRVRRAVASALGFVVVMVVLWWGGIILTGLNPFFARTPVDVARVLLGADDGGAVRDALFAALGQTAALAVPGYLAGLAVGAGLAMLLVLAPSVAAVTMPIAIALRAVPIVTTAPLVVLLLGRGAAGGIVLVAIMVFFPTLIACLQGLRQAPGQALDVLRSYAAPARIQLVRVRIPAMLPSFFAAARMSVPAAVLAVTVVEWLATGTGIGNAMALAASRSGYDLLAGATVLVTAASALGYALVGAVESRVLRRYAPEQRW